MNAKPLLILVALFSLLPTVPSQARDPDPPGGPMALPLLLRKLDRNFRVLYVTAHPDDEDAALLSWLAWGQGVDVTLLTLTHGEGGQNEIGPELGPDLAQLRVWELMAAARYHGAQQAFEDFADFGYSFSVEETLERWGEATAIERIAQRIRLLRPDVVITMEPFGEGGGQHHQASAKLTARAVERVNSEVEANDDANWLGVRRVFARLWQATPDLPICTVDTGAYDPLLGKSHFENGVVARGMHKCQGMVRDHAPFSAEPSRLALLLNRHSRVDAPSQPFDGLDETGLEWEGQATEAGLHLREAAQSLRDAWRPEGVDLVPGLLALERWR
ncbi:MAG: PIG-L family deacetylase, partial [Planctomycetes bacterium]|nr:PIG-L family deacetylase [Planctomycetota bacterium]